jgi:protoporphyrinogen oxidase
MDVTAKVSTASRDAHVLIVGGGIAGLSAALRVRALAPHVAVTVLESGSELGGKIAGEVLERCVVDGGADVCIGEKLRSTHLFTQLDLAAHVLRVNPDSLPTYESRDGLLKRFPTSYSGELLTFSGGMRSLITLACSALSGVTVRTGARASALIADGSNWRVNAGEAGSFSAGAVIIASPARSAATLLSAVAAQAAALLPEIDYPATTTVTMGWQLKDVPRPLDGTGYLVADASARVSACTWVSSKNPAHAPDGIALLRCYIRGTTGDPASLMRGEVASVLGITADPLFTRMYRWDAGIPAYAASHSDAVRELTDSLRATPGVFIAGSAFHGVGIPDCILSGERAASGAIAHIAESQTEAAA